MKKLNEMSLDELDAHLEELTSLQTQIRANLTTIDVDIDELTDEGVDIVFSKIFKLTRGASIDWKVIGPLMEENKLNLQYSEGQNEWDASEQDGLDFICGSSPCISIARLLIIKSLRDNSSSEYLLQLAFGTAKTLLKNSGGNNANVMVASKNNVADVDVVKLRLISSSIY